jgi:hypothetical protein
MLRIDTIGKTAGEWTPETMEADPPLSDLITELVELEGLMYDPSQFGCPWMTAHAEVEWRKDNITRLVRHHRKHGNTWPQPYSL